jgi:hypothetical protein
MAGVDTTVLSGLEKDVFEKGVSEGVNNKFPLKEFFTAETTDADYLGGGGHIWAHHTGRNVSPMFTFARVRRSQRRVRSGTSRGASTSGR